MTHEPPTGRDASAHPGLERLAALEEGLLEPADATRVSEHVAGCEHCRAQSDQLENVRNLLRALPAEQMPAEVAARLDAAVANAASGSASGSQPTTVVPLAARRRSWRAHPTAAGLGAAAAVAALVAALVVGHNSSGSGGGSASSEQAGGAAQAPSTTVLNDLSSTASGTNYTTNNLASSVPQLVAGPSAEMMTKAAPQPAHPNTGASSKLAGGAVAGVPAALLRLHSSPEALRSCVLGIEAGGELQRPLAIDFAHYQGAPAVLVVLPGLNAGFLDAWFVGAACSASDAHLLGYKAIPSSASPSPGG